MGQGHGGSVALPANSAVRFHAGAFLGPLGGPMVVVMLPELASSLHTTPACAAVGIPAYMIPFAALQLVSGTLGARVGRRRLVTAAYVVYAASSLAAALAATLPAFVMSRALQGAASAFLAPLLLAGLADVVPRARLGRSVGTFTSVQTAGIALAAAWGGLASEVSWRLAFVALAGVASLLALVPPPDATPSSTRGRSTFRSLLDPQLARLSAAAFATYAGLGGIGFLVAVRAADMFGTGSATRGLVVAAFGATGLLFGRRAGSAVDRFGPVRVVGLGVALGTLVVAAIGLAGSVGVLACLWAVAGLASAMIWSGLNVLTIRAVPENRPGAASVVGAFKFTGCAVSPLLLIPVYSIGSDLAFIAAAAIGLLACVAIMPERAATQPVPAGLTLDLTSSLQ